jgi:L-lactate dehydrogenase complex protein LldG
MRDDVYKIIAMRRAFDLIKERQRVNARKIPDLEERIKRLRKVRESCVGDAKLMEEAISNLKDNGVDVRFAVDGEEAVGIILREIGDEKIVVKSKSNVSKEIGLTEKLENSGVEVIETDIGDRLIQLLNEKPSHPTGPAAHLSLEYILRTLNSKYNLSLQSADDVLSFLIRDIKNYVEKAKIGISGANAVTADGSIVLLHNEGNIFEVIKRPEKWIILATIDKLYPNVEEALNAAKIQTFYATGQPAPSFIEVISGVSKTADIEKKLFKGIHNPKEVIMILVDNKRKHLINEGFKELFYCIGCGSCVVNCPSHRTFGEKFRGGRFALFSAIHDRENLQLCLTCGKCRENCPLNIDIPSMVRKVRKGGELYNILASHVKWAVYAAYIDSLSLYLTLKEKIKE